MTAINHKRDRLKVWLHGQGIEIGALHHPLEIAPSLQVTYVDRLPESSLREHYPELDGQHFAPVSVIGSAENLSAFADKSLDFVIANHLLEHLEDPVRAFREFERVLTSNGVLYLALPDMRMIFDRERAPTTVEHLLDEHRNGPDRNRYNHFLDWATHVDHKEGGEAVAHARALMDKDYSIHFHCWNPEGFLEFFLQAKREFGIDLELVAFTPPEFDGDDEFISIFVRGASNLVRLPAAPITDSIGQTGARRAPQTAPLRSIVAASWLGRPLRAIWRKRRRWTATISRS